MTAFSAVALLGAQAPAMTSAATDDYQALTRHAIMIDIPTRDGHFITSPFRTMIYICYGQFISLLEISATFHSRMSFRALYDAGIMHGRLCRLRAFAIYLMVVSMPPPRFIKSIAYLMIIYHAMLMASRILATPPLITLITEIFRRQFRDNTLPANAYLLLAF